MSCIATGDDELQLLFPGGVSISHNFFILLGMVLGYRLLAYVALRLANWERR